VRIATDGADALAQFGATKPDAIVLDLMMPVMDGWTFLKACRQDPRHASIPVLVLAASHDLAATAPTLGAWACLAKAFDLDVLVAVVERLVEPGDVAPRVGR